MEKVFLEVLVDASGDGTKESDQTYKGFIEKVFWIDGDFDNGVDAVLSQEGGTHGESETILTLTDANDDAVHHPRATVVDESGTAVLQYTRHYIEGKLKLTVSAGGNAKTGGMHIYISKE